MHDGELAFCHAHTANVGGELLRSPSQERRSNQSIVVHAICTIGALLEVNGGASMEPRAALGSTSGRKRSSTKGEMQRHQSLLRRNLGGWIEGVVCERKSVNWHNDGLAQNTKMSSTKPTQTF